MKMRMPGIKRQVEGQIDKVSRMEEAQTEERTEQLVEHAYTYLREKTYPDGCSDTKKRVIRKKAAKFEVKDGELYYKQKQNGKVILVDLCVDLYMR